MRYILALAIGVGIIALQVYLSRSKHWIFGGIIPVCFTIFTVWCFSFHTLKLSFSTVCPFILLLHILTLHMSPAVFHSQEASGL